MSDLRELTDAELSIVGGGAARSSEPKPPIVTKLIEQIIIDIKTILAVIAERRSD
jgi:hypothetical protein